MKPASFTFDRRLYELLQEEARTRFTIRELRDAYAKRLNGTSFRLADVRCYVYEQIRRMVRIGWVIHDEERRARGQIYWLQSTPPNLKLIDDGFERSLRTGVGSTQKPSAQGDPGVPTTPAPNAEQRLEALHNEIRLDFLSSMGEAERYKLLLEDLPHLRNQVESEYLEARDRSSRLLGHLRAIEKTLNVLVTKR